MKRVRRIASDGAGLAVLCGVSIATRWLAQVILRWRDIVARGDLQPADVAMGDGPFSIGIKKYNCSFRIAGPGAVSGIREIYVRDVYLRDGWLTISPDATVVDLGANMGNFSALALAANPMVRVIAVEPSSALNQRFIASIGLNEGFLERAHLIRAFIGTPGSGLAESLAHDSHYRDAEWISQEELIRRCEIHRIDFLKCDIEGGEFGLLGPNSPLLSMTRSLACEVHAFAGDVTAFLQDIRRSGFVIGPLQRDPDGSVTFVARRGGVPAA